MWLPTRLRGALRSLEAAQLLQAEVQELARKIDALEALQVEREIQWAETRDQVFRHLKRVAAIKQHQDNQDPEEQVSGRPSQATVLAAKFGSKGGS